MLPSPNYTSSASSPQGPGFDANLLLETLPWGVLGLAPDGTLAMLNPAAEALWGVPAAAVLGHAPAQVQPAVLPPELLQALAQPATASPDATYWLPHTQQWIALRIAPAADGSQWVYWENVTANKEAARTAQEHRTQQRHTRELLAAVEVVAHTGSYEAELATMSFHFSEGMYRLFGEEPGAFTPSLDFIDARSHPDDVGPVMQVLEQAIAEKRPYQYVRRIYRADGQLRTLEAHGNVICNKAGVPVKLLGLVQDITERQQAAAEVLRVQQELAHRATDQYRTLFMALDQGYFLVEVEFDEHHQPIDILYLDANPAAGRMVGEDFTGRRLKDIDPAYEAYWYDIFGRVARTGISERLEQYADPDKMWYNFYVSKVGDETSRRVAVVFRDITERKQHEQALEEGKAQSEADLAGMRRLYELQSRLAHHNDVQAAFQDVLALACEFTSTDRGCVQFLSTDGARLEMFVWQGYPDDSPFISYFRYEGLKTGCEVTRVQRQRLIIEETVGFEGLEGTEAGAATYADEIRAAQSTPMTSRTGETIGVISTQFRQPHRPSDHELRLLDMLAWTAAEFLERHRADAALRHSEEKYRTLFETMDEAYHVIEMLFDAENKPVDYRFLESNPAFEKLTGLQNAAGKTVRELVPEIGEYLIEKYGTVALTGEPSRYSNRMAGLQDRWYDGYAFRLGGEGSRRVAVIFSEITERKRAEEALQQSEAQQKYLLQLSDALRPLAEPTAIQNAACQVLRAQLGASRVDFTEATGCGELRVVATDCTAGVANRLGLCYHIADYGSEIAAEFEAGRISWRDDVTTQPGISHAEKAAYAEVHVRAWANVPLVKHGRLVVMLSVHFPEAHAWTADELRLLEETAERTWAAAERARAEAALRESEALLQKAFSISTVSQLYFTLDGGMTAANEAFVRTSGYRREELLTLNWKALAAPEFGDMAERAAGELAERGETAPYETQFVRPDGSRWWGLCAPTRLKGEGPTAECMEFIVDISERKQAEEQLRAFTASLEALVAERTQALQGSHQRLNTIFEAVQLQLGYYEAVRDANGQVVDLRVVLANQAASEWLGLPAADAPGLLLSNQLPGLREMRVWQTITQVIETGQFQRLEVCDQADDTGAWFDVQYTRLGDGIILASRDITVRKQREQDLRESQELLQSVFDTSLISMSVLKAVRDETSAVQDFRIAMANKELARETGRTDLEGKLYAEEYPGIKLAGIYELMLGVLETGKPAGREYFYPYEGINKWYACQFVKMDDGLVAINLNITERKLAEEKSQEQAHFIARVNETIPDLLMVTELASGRVLYLNRAPLDAPGFKHEELPHLSLQEQTALLQMHPDDAALRPDYLARAAALADHEIAEFSYRVRFNTPNWRWFQVRGSVFQRDPATGAATQILSVAQDVTARKEAELQQAKSYQLLQQSEEVANLGSWEYDRATGEFLWSAGMYRLFGLPLGSPIRPETYLDFALPEDRTVAERIVRGLTTGRTGFEETLRIQVGEAVKTVRVKAAGAFDDDGKPLRMLGVDLDISDVRRLEAENLRMRLTQQQALFNAVLEAQEAERGRIAESLHNGVGQLLYATKLQLNQLGAGYGSTALNRADELLADAIRQTRTLSHELVPSVLSEFGLAAALRDIGRSLRGPNLRFVCTVELDEQQPLPQPLQVALYRIAQELAQNVVKHAQATEASLALEVVPGFVLMRAEDNGVGFSSASASSTGIGLRTTRDRVALLGGSVYMGSSPKFGTYVRIRIPLPSTSAAPSA
ncbi:PAS domain S-box protein [Hymenobacter sp. B1770]|uniref:PAS domain S-box protein n=1 Tax=Hymenobacter sp. B1770 TaxID=1718788 RepID=UPI003CF05F4B